MLPAPSSSELHAPSPVRAVNSATVLAVAWAMALLIIGVDRM
jgi:hypothetical protein